ncbi:hypothetical protein CASFOL_024407 [Castilleja foliolosa]|uniref:Uncharacterized protein n=1 Tax=Castilleja foliolosa TaxID=1961234 RepID=A0ABD3CN84_9LAMI
MGCVCGKPYVIDDSKVSPVDQRLSNKSISNPRSVSSSRRDDSNEGRVILIDNKQVNGSIRLHGENFDRKREKAECTAQVLLIRGLESYREKKKGNRLLMDGRLGWLRWPAKLLRAGCRGGPILLRSWIRNIFRSITLGVLFEAVKSGPIYCDITASYCVFDRGSNPGPKSNGLIKFDPACPIGSSSFVCLNDKKHMASPTPGAGVRYLVLIPKRWLPVFQSIRNDQPSLLTNQITTPTGISPSDPRTPGRWLIRLPGLR